MKPLRHRIIRKRRRRVALLIESSRAYGRGLFLGIAKFVREHHEWSVQSEEWKWTDAFPIWLRNWGGDGIIARVETPEMAAFIRQLGVPAVDLRGSVSGFGLPLIDTDDRKVANVWQPNISWIGVFDTMRFVDSSEPIIPTSAPDGSRSGWHFQVFRAMIYPPPMQSDGRRKPSDTKGKVCSFRKTSDAGWSRFPNQQESWRATTFAASRS